MFRGRINLVRRNLSAVNRSFSIIKDKFHLEKKYDAVVIGAGHNGIIAAFYLARAGKSVCVLERRHTIGGAAVTEEIVPGFKFSRASYVLGLLRPHIYDDLDLYRHGLHVYPRNPSSYTPIHEKYWKDFTAKSLTLGPDQSQNFKEISKFSENDAKAFPEYEDFLNRMIGALSPLLDSAPPDLTQFIQSGPLRRIKELQNFKPLYDAIKSLGVDAPKFLQLLTAPITKILNEWFESEPLKATLATDGVIGAMMSPSSPGSGYVLLHHVMAEVNGVKGAWGFPRGGMGAVTQAMGKAAKEVGVNIFVENTVEKIMVDSEGSAKGVRMENGNEIEADIILSNATPKVTFLDLLNKGTLPSEFEKEVRSIDYTSPVCKINVALKNVPDFTADPNANNIMPHHSCTVHLNCESTSFIEEAYQAAAAGALPTKPMIEMTLPTSCDNTLAPVGCHVALLFTQYIPTQLKQDGADPIDKDLYAKKVFNTVEEYAPGFESSIVGYEVLMPQDLEKIFGLTGGNIFHGSMALDQLYTARPTSVKGGPKTPIKGLYLCGSGSHPGGGVMGAPGFLAAKAALQN